MTRRKAIAQTAVGSIEEAAAELNIYAMLAADIDAIEAERAVRKAEIDKDCDARIGARADQLRTIFAMLKPWWAVSGDSVTGGKRRSAELGGCLIGVRTTTPKLAVTGPVAEKVQQLRNEHFDTLLKAKYTLDKAAIVRVLRDPQSPDRDYLGRIGFAVRQKDEFFIDRIAPRDDAGETVPEPIQRPQS